MSVHFGDQIQWTCTKANHAITDIRLWPGKELRIVRGRLTYEYRPHTIVKSGNLIYVFALKDTIRSDAQGKLVRIQQFVMVQLLMDTEASCDLEERARRVSEGVPLGTWQESPMLAEFRVIRDYDTMIAWDEFIQQFIKDWVGP